MIRNIIFDVGKVLVSYEPDAYMQRLGISKENQKKINEAMFQNKLWDTSDQGLGTPDEFLQKFIAGAPELADEITKIHKTVGNTVELFPYAMGHSSFLYSQDLSNRKTLKEAWFEYRSFLYSQDLSNRKTNFVVFNCYAWFLYSQDLPFSQSPVKTPTKKSIRPLSASQIPPITPETTRRWRR